MESLYGSRSAQHYIKRAGQKCPALSFDGSTSYSCIDFRIQSLMVRAEVGLRCAPNRAPSRGTTGLLEGRSSPTRDQPLCQRAQGLGCTRRLTLLGSSPRDMRQSVHSSINCWREAKPTSWWVAPVLRIRIACRRCPWTLTVPARVYDEVFEQ
jgi:hypothetical protein